MEIRSQTSGFVPGRQNSCKRGISFAKTDSQVLKLKFDACITKHAFSPLYKINIARA